MKVVCDKEIIKTKQEAAERAAGMSASNKHKKNYGSYLCQDCGHYHIYTKRGKKRNHQIPDIGIRSQKLHYSNNPKITLPANIINKLKKYK